MNCPLCSSDKTNKHFNRNSSDYFLCSNCSLIFMDKQKHINDEEKKLRYDKHKNDISDLGYRNFLMELAVPSFKLIDKSKKCLDYGCGPTKAMEHLFFEHGFKMDSYDPCFFFEIQNKEYDLITCNEVFEHFSNPKEELEKLFKLIKKDGFAVIGTNLWEKDLGVNTDLSTWHYLSDPTHVCFYSTSTFEFISKTFGFQLLEIIDKRVIILKVPVL